MTKTDLVVRDAVDTFVERLYMAGLFFFSFVALTFGTRCCYLMQREIKEKLANMPETERQKNRISNRRGPSANLLLTTNALEF